MKTILSAVSTSVVLLLSTNLVSGQVALEISDVFLLPSAGAQSGSVEIHVSHELTEDPLLAGFQVVLEMNSVSSAPAAKFVNIQAPTNAAYVFASFSDAPVGSTSTDGSIAQIGDFLVQESAALTSGESLGLINFELPGGSTVGDEYRIDFRVSPSETFLATGLMGRVPHSVNGAVIRVVPEPSTTIPGVVLLLIAATRSGRERAM